MRRNAPSSVLRLSVVGVVVISLFGAMLARLWYLQILAGPSLAVEAQQNRVRLIYSEAPRGRILDRHGQVLVDNDVVAAVVVDRAAVAERPDVLDRLAVLLGITRADLDARLADARFSPFKPVPVADAIAEETLVFLSEHAAEFPGVAAVERTRRRYPHGSLAAQALGYAGQINDRELAARPDEDYRPGDTIGKSGVELAYESDLRGEPSIEKLEVDREGRVLRTLSLKPAVPGNDVVLSIDLGLQQVAEESLAQGLEAARNVFDVEQLKRFLATAGSAVLLDPRDGSVLAMASSPSYDPSAFVDGIPESVFSALQAPENRYPLNNRVIQGLYPPGSTFKLVTARAGLDAGLVSAGQTVEDTGSIKVGNPPRTFQNARGKAHGRVDMVRAMAVSSDVYFYLLGQRFWEGRGRLGQDAIQEVAREMGLGSRTGLDLPFEASGRG
ncbi:MAG: penicillin-binding transpeptidase domain-containing protein [Acidimicrobiales bacterium]